MNDQLLTILSLVFVAIALVANVLFCLTLFRTMKCIPKSKRQFPAYFVWFFLIPLVGVVFEWMMLPFGIPNSIKKAAPTDKKLQKKAKTLYWIGLIQVILITFVASVHVLPLHFPDLVYVNQVGQTSISIFNATWGISSVIGIVFWIVYWVKVADIKNNYLASKD